MNQKKSTYYLVFILLLIVANISAQNIQLVSFNSNKLYSSGSGITVIINPTDTFKTDNHFILELSSINGNWTNSQIILDTEDFYTPAMNARIPENTATGKYKLRIRSTNPVTSIETPEFNITSGNAHKLPKIISSLPNNTNFFNCLDSESGNYIFGSHNQQDGATTALLNVAQRTLSVDNYQPIITYNIHLYDIINNTKTPLNHENGVFQIPSNLQLGTYVIETESLLDNISSIQSFAFLFHGNGTSLGNSSSEEICVGSSVVFNVDISSSGIGRNYMGSKYRVDFGDGTKPAELTQAQLLLNSKIEHIYHSPSCSETGSYFFVQSNMYSKGILNSCNEYSKNGSGVSKRVNASQPPSADFKSPINACINKALKISNTTIPGFYGAAGCKDASNFYWYYKKPGDINFTYVNNSQWIDAKNNLTLPASIVNTEGCWEIKLEAQNQDLCQTISEYIDTIRIEKVNLATFSSSADSICANNIIEFKNTSNAEINSCSQPVFSWTIIPSESSNNDGFIFIENTNNNTKDAVVQFSKPGIYNVTLGISNSCGNSISQTKTVVIYGSPQLNFTQKQISTCKTSDKEFNIDFGSTAYNPNYKSTPYNIEQYNWTISGVNVTASDYTFINNSNAHSAYPVIKFNTFKKFTITLELTGKCNLKTTDSIEVTISETPIIINTVRSQTICSGTKSADIVPNSNIDNINYTWTVTKTDNIISIVTGNEGLVINGQAFVNNSDSVGIVTYHIIPKNESCEGEVTDFKVYVSPETSMNQPADITVCSGEMLSELKFTSKLKGAINYKWTNNNTAIGLGAEGTGNLPSFTATNSGYNALKAEITVIPTAIDNMNSCTGESVTFSITVLPKAQVEQIADYELCNQEVFEKLEFSTKNTDGNTSYSWTNSNPLIGLKASGLGKIPTFRVKNNTDSTITAIIEVKAIYKNNGIECQSEPMQFKIRVKSSPYATISGSTNVCMGAPSPVITFRGSNGKTPYTFTYQLNDENIETIKTSDNERNYYISIPTDAVGNFTYKLISVSDSEGSCISYKTDTATVIVAENPIIKKQPTKNQLICTGGTIATLNIEFEGGVGQTTINWYSNSTNSNEGGTLIEHENSASFTPAPFNLPGDYYFYAIVTMNGSSCGVAVSETATVTVVADPVIEIQAEKIQSLCKNSEANTLVVGAAGGVSDYFYQWYKNSENNQLNAQKIEGANQNQYTPPTNVAGTFYYFCEVSQNFVDCAVNSDNAKVVVYETPAIKKQPISQTICKNEALPKLTVEYNFGPELAKYQWFENTEDNNYSGTAIPNATSNSYQLQKSEVGTYFYYCVISFETKGCNVFVSNVARIIINQFPVIAHAKIESASGLSFKFEPEIISGNIVPEGTVYTWSKPLVSPANAITGANANSTATKNISQHLINKTKNTASAKYTITPSFNGCNGAAFELTVLLRAAIQPNETIKHISCFGHNDGKIATNISGGIPFFNQKAYNIQWSGPEGFTANQENIENLKPGSYTLNITDSVGLTYNTVFEIIEPKKIELSIDSQRHVSCHGGNNGSIHISTSGGTGKHVYNWYKNGVAFSTEKDLANLQSGQYTLSVTDENQCEPLIANFLITEPEILEVNLNSQVNNICFGETNGSIEVTIQGGTPEYNYNWTGPNDFRSDEKNISNLAAGEYTLTVTDAAGCIRIFKTEITQNNDLKVEVKSTPVSCYGKNDATINLTVSGGVAPYEALWSNLATGFEQKNLSPAMYEITVKDAVGCSKVIKVNITKDSLFNIEPQITNVSCFGAADGSIKLNINSKSSTLKLKWSDGSTSGSERNNLSPGIYSVEISNGGPCTITESFVISEPAQLVIDGNIKHAFSCDNTTGGSIDISVQGGEKPYQYSWSNGFTTEDIANLNAGIYFLTVVDAKNCSATEAFQVIKPLPLKINIESNLDYKCDKSEIKQINTAHVSGGIPPYQISWSGGVVSGIKNEIMTSNENMTVFVTVTDAAGCSKTAAFNNEIPETGIAIDVVDCDKMTYGFDMLLPENILNNIKYFWEFGDGGTSEIKNPVHTYLHSGKFNIKLQVISNESNCSFEKTVNVDSLPVLVLDKQPLLCLNDSVTLRVSGARKYIWNDGTTGDIKVIKREGNYSVTGQSTSGCTSTLRFNARYYDNIDFEIFSDRDIVTPENPTVNFWTKEVEASSYNWDFGESTNEQTGHNVNHTFNINRATPLDVKLNVTNPYGCEEVAAKRIWLLTSDLPNTFTPNGDGLNDKFLEGTDLEVYNSNGVLLYKGRDGWDGTFKGKAVAIDTYYYVVMFYTPDGMVSKPGYITVLR